MAEGGDEDSERGLVFGIVRGESIASPPFAQNAKDGPPAKEEKQERFRIRKEGKKERLRLLLLRIPKPEPEQWLTSEQAIKE